MRFYKNIFLVVLALTGLLSNGCTKNRSAAQSEVEIPPAGLAGTNNHAGSINLDHPPISGSTDQANAQAQKDRPVLTGKVVEAIYKEGFAYLRLEVGADTSTWAAVVNQKPTVGQTISLQEQAVLTDFHSKSLDRTFAKIIFGSIVN